MIDQPHSLHDRRPSVPSKLRLRIGSLDDVRVPKHLRDEIESARPDSPDTPHLSFSLSVLRRVSQIGSGISGSVSLMIYKPLNIKMACKVLTISSTSEEVKDEQSKQIQRELRILRKCRSEYVVTFFGAFLEDDKLHIMLEWMDLGSLDKILLNQGPIPENHVVVIASQLLKGLAYIHDELQVMHRDIKPGNMLLNSKGIVKISDFGISKERANNGPSTFVGTLIYLAPETAHEKVEVEISYAVDIWAFGLSIMELATGHFPYAMENLKSPFEMVPLLLEEPSPTLPMIFSVPFRDFIQKCLVKDPDERPPAYILSKSLFIVEGEIANFNLKDWISSFRSE